MSRDDGDAFRARVGIGGIRGLQRVGGSPGRGWMPENRGQGSGNTSTRLGWLKCYVVSASSEGSIIGGRSGLPGPPQRFCGVPSTPSRRRRWPGALHLRLQHCYRGPPWFPPLSRNSFPSTHRAPALETRCVFHGAVTAELPPRVPLGHTWFPVSQFPLLQNNTRSLLLPHCRLNHHEVWKRDPREDPQGVALLRC